MHYVIDKHQLALSIFDPIELRKTTFATVIPFSDFRPCCYGVARCINWGKIISAHLPS